MSRNCTEYVPLSTFEKTLLVAVDTSNQFVPLIDVSNVPLPPSGALTVIVPSVAELHVMFVLATVALSSAGRVIT